mmetsp:Transcript_10067/g.25323  ORF Transcript_10067/g.25323 Transcript_10067/m.25323 type:complete len:225 (-) Transcript_10067:376-1050(-)
MGTRPRRAVTSRATPSSAARRATRRRRVCDGEGRDQLMYVKCHRRLKKPIRRALCLTRSSTPSRSTTLRRMWPSESCSERRKDESLETTGVSASAAICSEPMPSITGACSSMRRIVFPPMECPMRSRRRRSRLNLYSASAACTLASCMLRGRALGQVPSLPKRLNATPRYSQPDSDAALRKCGRCSAHTSLDAAYPWMQMHRCWHKNSLRCSTASGVPRPSSAR